MYGLRAVFADGNYLEREVCRFFVVVVAAQYRRYREAGRYRRVVGGVLFRYLIGLVCAQGVIRVWWGIGHVAVFVRV